MIYDRFNKIVRLFHQQQADSISLTGDYISKNTEKFALILQVLQLLKSKDINLNFSELS